MRIKYFADTDTALIELSDRPTVETRELNENVYLDLDADGNVVSLTIEHARQAAGIDEFTYQRVPVPTHT
ncbi:MAG: DUF2283 domain-containing protein [Anaerolineae bacterium]|nr:DUF2283 domain-containing protein [Anaerolineae bacterium]